MTLITPEVNIVYIGGPLTPWLPGNSRGDIPNGNPKTRVFCLSTIPCWIVFTTALDLLKATLLFVNTLPMFNSSPLKSYRAPIGKACLPTIIFQGRAVELPEDNIFILARCFSGTVVWPGGSPFPEVHPLSCPKSLLMVIQKIRQKRRKDA